jgi:hypothetical protein
MKPSKDIKWKLKVIFTNILVLSMLCEEKDVLTWFYTVKENGKSGSKYLLDVKECTRKFYIVSLYLVNDHVCVLCLSSIPET